MYERSRNENARDILDKHICLFGKTTHFELLFFPAE